MNIKALLDQRDSKFLKFYEPWPTLDINGEDNYGDTAITMSVSNCINRQRYQDHKSNKVARVPHKDIRITDRELLLNFIAINTPIESDSL